MILPAVIIFFKFDYKTLTDKYFKRHTNSFVLCLYRWHYVLASYILPALARLYDVREICPSTTDASARRFAVKWCGLALTRCAHCACILQSGKMFLGVQENDKTTHERLKEIYQYKRIDVIYCCDIVCIICKYKNQWSNARRSSSS